MPLPRKGPSAKPILSLSDDLVSSVLEIRLRHWEKKETCAFRSTTSSAISTAPVTWLNSATARVVDSGWYIFGDEGVSFEREFAAYCGTRACVGVANGTDGLEFALRAVGVAPGSRVATVANAGFYTSTALLAIGAAPVFVDVEPDTHLMDLDALRSILSGRIDAVVVTHLYGLLHDMAHLLRITDAHGVPVIEDCAQAHGAIRRRKKSRQLRAGSSLQLLSYQKSWRASAMPAHSRNKRHQTSLPKIQLLTPIWLGTEISRHSARSLQQSPRRDTSRHITQLSFHISISGTLRRRESLRVILKAYDTRRSNHPLYAAVITSPISM